MSQSLEQEKQAAMQRWMLNTLVKPESTEKLIVEQNILPSPTLSAKQCLQLYQQGYITRLTRCLAEQFPALNNALGDALFRQFAQLFLRQYPSNSYTLYDLGKRFAEFLDSDRPDKEQSDKESWIDFMIELAQYEQLHFSLFDAPGHEGNSWPAAETEDSSLILQPCFALSQTNYPVAWYYHSCKTQPDIHFPPKAKSYVALARKDFYVTTYPLTEIHYLFLSQIQKHDCIKTGLEYVSSITGRPFDEVQLSWHSEVKQRWLNAGFFISR